MSNKVIFIKDQVKTLDKKTEASKLFMKVINKFTYL